MIQAFGKKAAQQSNDLGENSAHRRAKPCDLDCTFTAAGANGGPNHRDEWRAEAERDRDQQIFQPRADTIACDRGGTVDCNERGRDCNREICRHGDDAGDQADAQDVARQSPA